jgi:hypothetical protein
MPVATVDGPPTHRGSARTLRRSVQRATIPLAHRSNGLNTPYTAEQSNPWQTTPTMVNCRDGRVQGGGSG